MSAGGARQPVPEPLLSFRVSLISCVSVCVAQTQLLCRLSWGPEQEHSIRNAGGQQEEQCKCALILCSFSVSATVFAVGQCNGLADRFARETLAAVVTAAAVAHTASELS